MAPFVDGGKVTDSTQKISPNSSRSASLRFREWSVASLVTLILHYCWEMAQAPLYRELAGMSFWEHAVPCFRGAAGDVVIAMLAYSTASIAGSNWQWPFERNWPRSFFVCLVIGILITIAFEYYAQLVGRWSYTGSMPTFLDLGLSPLAQWLIVPAMTLFVLQFVRRKS